MTHKATGEIVDHVDRCSTQQVVAAVARARAAQPRWQALGFEGRARVLDAFRRRLVRHRDLVLEALVTESGKPVEDADADLTLVVAWAKWWADHAAGLLADETITSWSPFVLGRRNVVTYEPRGVVGVIGPWNVPLSLTVGDGLAALMAGNGVVLKPSELTPLSVLLARRLWLEAGGPDGVLEVVTGDGATGAALVDEVDFVMFTGSVATGKKVAARATARLVPFSLELGGKDAMIVLADAHLERAANAAAHYGLFNAGQVCMGVERVYVEAPVYDRFLELLVDRVRRLRQGPPGGPGSVELSAMIHAPQRDIVDHHVRDAVDRGARVLLGGEPREDGGVFYPPTILVDVDHSMACMREETFGPTIPVMEVADAEEAVTLANDSDYGLTASVWTSDLARGEALARRIEAGTVTVNDAFSHLAAAELPFGGWKSSGLGVRNGPDGIRKYCRQRAIQVNRLAPRRDPHWFPYTPTTSRVLARAVDVLYGRPTVRLRSSRPVAAARAALLARAPRTIRRALSATLRRSP